MPQCRTTRLFKWSTQLFSGNRCELITSHHIAPELSDSTMVTTLPCQLLAKGALGCEHWTACVWVYRLVCVYVGHVTARFLLAVSLWNVWLGTARRDWRGVVCDPCFIICLVSGYGGWWAVTDTRQDQSPPLAGSQTEQTGRKQRLRSLRGVTGPYLVWSGCVKCSGRIFESTYSQCLRWQGGGPESGIYLKLNA